MSNANGNASTDGVLTVTLANDVSPIATVKDSKSLIANSSGGSVSSSRSYSNSSFGKKYVPTLKIS